MTEKVLIVGGGIVGLSCAHYLCDAGYSVTVIDRATIGGACSYANCGYICPSHVLPLTEPGMVKMAIKSMFKRHSPFKVKPRFDLDLLRFMVGFARRCNTRDMIAGGHALQPLLNASMAEYRKLVQHPEIECEWTEGGMLYVFKTQQAMDHFGEMDALVAREFGLPAKKLDGRQLREKEPALKEGLLGGYFYDCDATLRGRKLHASWKNWLETRGVQFIEQCEARILHRDGTGPGAKLRSIETSGAGGKHAADHFVFALGAWSPKLQKQLGCRIPVQPGKGYSITMDRPDPCPKQSMLFPETRVGVTPFEDAYRLGSMMEFVGYDDSIKPERIGLLRKGAEPYLQAPHTPRVHEEWTGWRPMTPDTLPIIGRVPRCPNAYLATGHNMIGQTLGPVTGRLITELITGSKTILDVKPYAVERF
ncbi:MAG: FAD-dependent oxidoreductase [Phycisphaera sp.]|nr:FAD-dependent oxidoreductase [Phycisphaera sp.]